MAFTGRQYIGELCRRRYDDMPGHIYILRRRRLYGLFISIALTLHHLFSTFEIYEVLAARAGRKCHGAAYGHYRHYWASR